MPVGDGDASTSDGLFVSTGAEPAPLEAMPGNEVCVEGQVTELVNWDDVNAPHADRAAGQPRRPGEHRTAAPGPRHPHRRRHAGRQRRRRPRALRRHARPRRVARRRLADDCRSRRLPRRPGGPGAAVPRARCGRPRWPAVRRPGHRPALRRQPRAAARRERGAGPDAARRRDRHGDHRAGRSAALRRADLHHPRRADPGRDAGPGHRGYSGPAAAASHRVHDRHAERRSAVRCDRLAGPRRCRRDQRGPGGAPVQAVAADSLRSSRRRTCSPCRRSRRSRCCRRWRRASTPTRSPPDRPIRATRPT